MAGFSFTIMSHMPGTANSQPVMWKNWKCRKHVVNLLFIFLVANIFDEVILISKGNISIVAIMPKQTNSLLAHTSDLTDCFINICRDMLRCHLM